MDAQKIQRRVRSDLTVIAVSLAIAFLIAPTWGLAQVAAGPYTIDGIVPDAGCCSEFLDPVGSIKELGPVNASTTKLGNIHLAAPPMLNFTNPNSSTDLAAIWLETKRDSTTGDIWLYFAWEREASSGSSVISYELQSAPADAACDFSSIDQTEPASADETALINACNPWSNRQAGDFMIVWDFGGGSTDIVLRTFDGAGFDVGANLSADGNAFASLNIDSTRGEGAINLSATIFNGLQSCFNIANVIPGTITGNSDQADYKDTVLADIGSAVTISNCGTVNITKVTEPVGQSGNFSYTLDRAGNGSIDYDGNTSATGTLFDHGGSDQLVVIPGSDYQLLENLATEPYFALQSILCDKPSPDTDGESGFTVNAAESTDCIITNELRTGTIKVIKTVVNAYGGSATAADFCIDLNDDEITSSFSGNAEGTLFTFIEDTVFNVAEVACGNPDTSPPGYTPSFSGECSGAIEARVDKECTITNTQLAQPTAPVTLLKNLLTDNGGTANKSDWTLSATLQSDAPDSCTSSSLSGADLGSGVGGSLSVSDNVAQCVYELAESGGPASGYTASNWTCSGDVALTGNEITVGPGGGSCAITNDDDAPSLTLVKTVTNDNGGTSVASDWTLAAAGYDSVSPDAGTYSLSESGPGGYTQTSLMCTNSGDTQVSSVTLGLGEDVTCTFVNDDDAPSLTLVKTVTNDNGGTSVAVDWALTAAGPTPISGAGGVSSDASFEVGTYALSEFGPGNYVASGWACTGGVQVGSSVTLGLGESAICTINNDDVQPVLTVIKTVLNDNGGLLDVADFPLLVGTVEVVSDEANGFDAGSYTVSEINQAGYEGGSWGGDCAANGSIVLAIGDEKTCSITNDDIPPELKIVKSALQPVIIPGVELSYTITVTNIGGGDALNVVLTDLLPPTGNSGELLSSLPWTTSTEGCSIDNSGAMLTCDVGTLAKDPTPEQHESGDEASFTANLSVIVPDNYLELSDDPGGSGTLGSNFEIDGNLVDDSNTPGLDWNSSEISVINVLDPPIIDLSPDFPIDDAFIDGAKENDPAPSVQDHSIPPNKSDLTNFLIAQDEVDGIGFLALGWIRTDSLGTSNFDFELNQSSALSANGVTPARTTGDVLFSFDFESSGNVVMLLLREWDDDAATWSEPRALNIEGTGFAAINDPELFGTAENGVINPFTGEAMPDQSFGEALINLTRTFRGECRSFVSAYVKGRSSTPFTAVLKDFIAPIPTEIDTCRTIEVLNEATADASNPGQDPVSDSAIVTLSNDPDYTGDPDGDGTANYLDPDDDNDGVPDDDDAFPFDPSEWADSDGDGYGDNSDALPNDPNEWADSDGDGVGDNSDAFPNDPTEWADSDGDGAGDNGDAFPNNASEWLDTDGDGIGNNADPDDDNDGLNDFDEFIINTDPLNPDTDGDGVNDGADAFPLDPNEWLDSDGDGVGDNGDAFPNDPSEWADTDGDGVGDNADAFPNDPAETLDGDGDGVGDNSDAFPNDPSEWADTDGDGVGDNADAFPSDPAETLDSDGDGVGDNSDTFPNDPSEWADTDGDGVGDNADAFPNDPSETLDSDGDGVGNNADAFPNDSSETLDSDGDGVGNNSDAFPNDATEWADSDGDGVGDNADAFPNDPSETLDSDGDGVGDNADAFPNNPSETLDSDGDGIGNNADPDDDNDGLSDFDEFVINTDPLNPDTDGDGVNDGADAFPLDPNEQADSDGDGVGDNSDTFPNDPSESADTDGDGVGDNADAFPTDPAETLDSDGDGVGDNSDAFPNDPSEWADSDGDGVGDNSDALPSDPSETLDSDGDGVGDNSDAFPNDPSEWADTDGDGVGDNADAFPTDPAETTDTDADGVGDNGDAFPNDPGESVDTDSDGVGDNGDAFPTDPTETTDTDSDGVGDNSDALPMDPGESTDTDGDGVGDNADAFPNDPSEWADTDGDGVGDNADAFPTDPAETTDTDADGVGDNGDAFPNDPGESADTDSDGVGDNEDVFPTDPAETTDTDADGVGDNGDAFPNDPGESVDTDSDGVGDNGDALPNDPTETTDTDSDGVGDNSDAFPNDPSEWTDSDGDGVGDNSDAFPLDPDASVDTDGDGVSDGDDAFPSDPTETSDADGDGVGDNGDVFPTDPNETTDTDSDGVGDNSDAFPTDPTETTDTDSDGIGDNADMDDDNDGVDDPTDAFPTDPSETTDTDGDGVGDNSDAFPTDPTETTDTDNNGIGNNADTDNDGDGVDDSSDAFPNDPNEWADSDGDGVGDNSDAFPNDPKEWADSDGDGIGDNADAGVEQIDEIVVTAAPKSSGGGAIDLLALMLLGWMVLHRQTGRRRRNPVH